MSKQGISAHPIITHLDQGQYPLAAKAIAKCEEAAMADGIYSKLQMVIEANKKDLRSIDPRYFKCWKAFLRNSALIGQLNENDLKSLFKNIYKLQNKLIKEALKTKQKEKSQSFKDEKSASESKKQKDKGKKKAKDKAKDHKNYQALEDLSFIFFESESLHSRLPLSFFFRGMKAESKLAMHLASKINYLLKLSPEMLNLFAWSAPYEVLKTLSHLVSIIERPDIVALSQLKYIFVHNEAIRDCIFKNALFKEQLECLCEALRDDATFRDQVARCPHLVQNTEIKKTLDRLNQNRQSPRTFTPAFDHEQQTQEIPVQRLTEAFAKLSLKPNS